MPQTTRDPMFLIINAIILIGLVTTAVGTALQRRERKAPG